MEPTLIEPTSLDTKLMQEEIFGPILPVIGFGDLEEAKGIVRQNPDPLAFYLFTTSAKNETLWLQSIASGGVAINNCSWHLTNPNLPFGGRGDSGMGAYHGKYSFDTFSQKRAVMKTPNWFDPFIKYPPFKGRLKFFKWLVR